MKKTKFSWFCSNRGYKKCPKSLIKIKGSPIQEVSKFTYLGAHIDRPLTMAPHANASLQSTNFLGFKLGMIRHMIPTVTAIKIFKQTILPKFDYCSFLITSCTMALKRKIQRTQNRILRCALGVQVWDEHVQTLHDLCETPLQETRRNELITSLMYTIFKRSPPPHLRLDKELETIIN